MAGPDFLDAFRATATAHADRAALWSPTQTVTYGQLARQVDGMAGVLVAAGAVPGAIGVEASHCPDTITALLAIWTAGGTYCPVDAKFPAARRSAMLAAAGCRTILDPLTQTLSAVDGPLSAEGSADDAYILFTSGSTGAPKPVVTPRGAITATVASLRDLFELRASDRVLQFASLNWDTCFEEILPTLTTGATLVFHEDAHSGSLPRFLRLVQRQGITVLDLPTAFWHELVTHLVEDEAPLPECVRLVIIGGEAANPARLVDWQRLPTGHARLLNTYGSTETTLITHAVDLAGPQAQHRSWSTQDKVPIGRALPHIRERVSDDGELLIGGPALATGYRGMPQVTADRFLSIDGERFFRTGDRVSRLPDATLVPQGRLDAELKIRGIRVDPAEVEAHIGVHPAVRAVAVTGIRKADHTVLAAYVVARHGADTTDLAASIRSHLRTRLPAHLVPSHINVVADLVYTSSGKVDRHRIKEAFA